MASKKITDLAAKTTPDNTDLFVVGNAGTATMRKLTFANLKAKIFGESDWTDVKYTTDFTAYSSAQALRYKKAGNIVQLVGISAPTKELKLVGTSGEATICTLPDGFRPSQEVRMVQQGSLSNKWLLTIKPSGTVSLARYGTTSFLDVPTTAWLPINCVFFVD